jgi:hypothetical protein
MEYTILYDHAKSSNGAALAGSTDYQIGTVSVQCTGLGVLVGDGRIGLVMLGTGSC